VKKQNKIEVHVHIMVQSHKLTS